VIGTDNALKPVVTQPHQHDLPSRMTPAAPALELKGRMLSATRVRLLSSDPAAIVAQLASMARQMPQAVQGMAVIVEADQPVDLPPVLEALRQVGMQPLGVCGEALAEAARGLGLAVLPPDNGRSARPGAAAPAVALRKPPRLVHQPVRGGQQIHAADSELIVLNTVSAGAEVMADGCVHIYGALRGRAMAGVRGDENARIFCRRFEPELVAIAGVYAVAEQLRGELHGKPVQVYLLDGRLQIERLDA
jgi:septum site-determining protein MinC